MAQESQEVIVETFEAYVAPVATAFPACSATPAGEWKPVGKQGTDSYSEPVRPSRWRRRPHSSPQPVPPGPGRCGVPNTRGWSRSKSRT
jgi:hypothetical protein